MDNSFQKALQSGDPPEVAKFPKADLHSHSMLGCRLPEAEAIYGKPLQPFVYAGNGIHDVNRWISGIYAPVFRDKGNFRKILAASFMQALSDGVTILEMSIDAGFGNLFGI